MKHNAAKGFALVLAVVLAVGIMPVSAWAAPITTIDISDPNDTTTPGSIGYTGGDDDSGDTWVYDAGAKTLTIKKGGVTLTGTNAAFAVVVENGAAITLKNADITSTSLLAITFTSGGSLTSVGTNRVTHNHHIGAAVNSSNGDFAIAVQGGNLTLDASSSNGLVVGSDVTTITLRGGAVFNTRGGDGPGISSIGDLVISGEGTVNTGGNTGVVCGDLSVGAGVTLNGGDANSTFGIGIVNGNHTVSGGGVINARGRLKGINMQGQNLTIDMPGGTLKVDGGTWGGIVLTSGNTLTLAGPPASLSISGTPAIANATVDASALPGIDLTANPIAWQAPPTVSNPQSPSDDSDDSEPAPTVKKFLKLGMNVLCDNTAYTGQPQGLVFTVTDASPWQLEGVAVDLQPLTEGAQFTKGPGSTVITLLPKYLDTLEDGWYVLSLTFTEHQGSLVFTVDRSGAAQVPEPESRPEAAAPDSTYNPNTGL